MLKFIKWKNITEFLKKEYPENLWTTKKLPKRHLKIIQEKWRILEKIKKRFKYIKNFIFSYDQLKNVKNDILKKQIQYRVFSDFLMKLKEKKKFSILYGNISKKFFEKAYRQSANSRGKINENLLTQFEMRLDVLLYRISFCKNIYAAKQYITHNYVNVNGKLLNIPSYQVKAGDVVSIDLAKKNRLVNYLLEYLKTTLSKRRFRFLISHKYLQKYIKNSDDLCNTIKKLKARLRFLISRLIFNQAKKKEEQKRNRYSNFYGSNPKQILSKREQRRVSLHSSSNKFQRRANKFQRRANKFQRRENKFQRRANKFGLLEKINHLNQSLNLLKNQSLNLLKNQSLNLLKKRLKLNLLKKRLKLNQLKINEKYLQKYIEKSLYNLYLKDKIILKIKRFMRLKRSHQQKLSAMRISPMKPLHLEVSYKLLTAIVLFSPQKISFPTLLNLHLLSRSLTR